ncbi:hypothetical protein ACHAXS_002549 [Conticribra weissflogii]
MVHDEEKFTSIVLPSFSNATQMKSFSRQLNLWGFKRYVFIILLLSKFLAAVLSFITSFKTIYSIENIETCPSQNFLQLHINSFLNSFQHLYGRNPSGKDTGAWFHESFLRGKPNEVANIIRTKIKGAAGVEARKNFEIPDFYAVEPSNNTKESRKNEFHDKKISNPIAFGAASFMFPEKNMSHLKFCIECCPQTPMVSTQNPSLNVFSNENPSNNNIPAYRSRRGSLDFFLDSNTSGTQSFINWKEAASNTISPVDQAAQLILLQKMEHMLVILNSAKCNIATRRKDSLISSPHAATSMKSFLIYQTILNVGVPETRMNWSHCQWLSAMKRIRTSSRRLLLVQFKILDSSSKPAEQV